MFPTTFARAPLAAVAAVGTAATELCAWLFSKPREIRGRCLRLQSILVLAALCGGGIAKGQNVSREFQIKAAFLFNFVQFTEWPTNAFASTNSPIVIGVLGSNPFGSVLEEIVRNEKINGRSIVVSNYTQVRAAINCHVLFISRSEEPRLEATLDALKGRPVLTVSDMDYFADDGGMIQFVTERNRIRLRVDADAARAANVKLSSKVLKLAEVVRPKQN